MIRLFEPAKTFDQIVTDIEQYLADNQSKLTDWNPGSIVRTFAEAIAFVLSDLYQRLADDLKQAFIETSEGEYLDKKVADIGVTRKAATKAEGTVTFSRSSPAPSDIVIPAGTRVRTQVDSWGNSQTFVTKETVTLIAGQSSVDVDVIAEVPGAAGNVTAHSVSVIVDPINGIETVDNANAFSGGTNEETDDELRARAITYLLGLAKATPAAIKAGALSVPGVKSATIIENDPSPGYVKVYVADESGTATQQLLNVVDAELENYRGIATVINVYSPQPVSVSLTLTVTVETGHDAATVRTDVQTALQSYLNGLEMGSDVIRAKVIAVAMGVNGVTNVSVGDFTGSITGEVVIESAAGGETTAQLNHGNVVAGSYTIYKNGVALTETTDYTINTSTGEITFAEALIQNDQITADYSYSSATDLVISIYEKPRAGTVTVN